MTNSENLPIKVANRDVVVPLPQSGSLVARGLVAVQENKQFLAAWHDLKVAVETGTLVEGYVHGKVKGGFTVMVNGVSAFLPSSLACPYVAENKTMSFMVIKLDRKCNIVVVSRRAPPGPTDEDRQKLTKMIEGTVVTGVVKNITEYGAFVDLDGIDGFLHITDLAWRRVKHPSEVLTEGEVVEVKILKIDQEKCRVFLGIKQMGDDPWMGVNRRYPQGTRLFGNITHIVDVGAFVELEPGIEGLVHVTDMDWTNKAVAPNKVVQLGDEVEVMVLEIDEEHRRLSLGMKQFKANPWGDFALTHKVGDKVRGEVIATSDEGMFIGLDEIVTSLSVPFTAIGEWTICITLNLGIDGFFHLSDPSWLQPGEEILAKYKLGDKVESVLLHIDLEGKRIYFGIKPLKR